ncbi:MAG: hypothetical protein ABIV13_04965 [Fimbriimonadales bacterium]
MRIIYFNFVALGEIFNMPIPFTLPVAGAAFAIGHAALQEPEPPLPEPTPRVAGLSNIEMSMVFDVRGVLQHPDPDERHITINEIEFGFKSDVDPFWTAEAYLGLHRHHGEEKEGKGHAEGYEIEIEEAFARYGGFGHGVDGKVGKFKAAVGRLNRNHRDQYEFLDIPFVLADTLGEEGLAAPGVSVSYLLPTNRFNEVTLELLDPDDGPLFSGARLDSPVIVGHYRTFFDFNPDTSGQLGFTYANGPTEGGSRSHLYGADWVMKYQPGTRGRSWVLEAEAYGTDSGLPGGGSTFGGFAAFTYEFMPRWFGTAKADYSELPGTSDIRRGVGLGVAYKATEFQHLRLEWQRVASNLAGSGNVVTLQFQYLIGKHPAHKY